MCFCRSALELKGCSWSQRPLRDAAHNFPTTCLITLRKADASPYRENFLSFQSITCHTTSPTVCWLMRTVTPPHPLPALTSSTHLSFSLAQRRHTNTHMQVRTHLLTNLFNSTCDSLRCFITSVSIAVPAFLTHRRRKTRPDTF